MVDNNTNTQQTAGQAGQQEQGGADQQQGKLFTQADVDRIVQNRVSRMRQELDTSDSYRRERDEARRELEQYKNDAFLKEKGVKDADRDYVAFKAAQLVDGNTSFQQAAEKFLKDNPRYTGRGFRVVSTGVPSGGPGGGGSIAGDADIREAMGLK